MRLEIRELVKSTVAQEVNQSLANFMVQIREAVRQEIRIQLQQGFSNSSE